MLPLRLSRSRVSAMARVSSRSAKPGLSKYAAEAAEQAALHQDKLGIAGKVKVFR